MQGEANLLEMGLPIKPSQDALVFAFQLRVERPAEHASMWLAEELYLYLAKTALPTEILSEFGAFVTLLGCDIDGQHIDICINPGSVKGGNASCCISLNHRVMGRSTKIDPLFYNQVYFEVEKFLCNHYRVGMLCVVPLKEAEPMSGKFHYIIQRTTASQEGRFSVQNLCEGIKREISQVSIDDRHFFDNERKKWATEGMALERLREVNREEGRVGRATRIEGITKSGFEIRCTVGEKLIELILLDTSKDQKGAEATIDRFRMIFKAYSPDASIQVLRW